MSDKIIIRKARINDIDFLVDTIIAAEKSGTENLGLAKLFGLTEYDMRLYIKSMLEEEIDGCEFSISNYLVAENNGKVISAFAGWIEGRNELDLPSAIIKSNLISYCIPSDRVKFSKYYSDIISQLQIDREEETYQLEYSYTLPEYRGRGILGLIMKEHEKIVIKNGISKMQVHVFNNNQAGLNLYIKNGFIENRRLEVIHNEASLFFPSNVLLLMEKLLK